MKNRALIAAAATGFFVLGCASTPSAQAPAPRPAQTTGEASFETKARSFLQEYTSLLCSGSCTITVTVLENCGFRVTPWTLGLPRGPQNVPIHWRIDTRASVGNPKFAATQGIFFKAGDWAREFDSPRRVSDTHFMWNDRNPPLMPMARPFAYGINVVQNDRPCPTLDPTIVNDY